MKIFVPGKLMLSGEWCVLEKGLPCIVMAVNVGVVIKIEESNQYCFSAPDLQIPFVRFAHEKRKIVWRDNLTNIEKAKLLLSKTAMELTLNYLASKQIPLKMFSLETSSKDTIVKNKVGKKYKIGLGSSAAIATGIVAGILQLHDFDVQSSTIKKIIFKIACLAHYTVQEKLGSGFDIAASVWGGILYYKRFDGEWLSENVAKNDMWNIIDASWPGLYVENLKFPKNLEVIVGFVGYSANTKKLIHSMQAFRSSFSEKYMDAMVQIAEIVDDIKNAFLQENEKEILRLVKENRYRLQSLNQFSQKKLETDELALLADIAEKNNAAGKFSGAGGGDCGIAIVQNQNQKDSILHMWKKNKIVPINIGLANTGVHPLE